MNLTKSLIIPKWTSERSFGQIPELISDQIPIENHEEIYSVIGPEILILESSKKSQNISNIRRDVSGQILCGIKLSSSCSG